MLTKQASRNIIVTRREGLHARPCVAIANTVRQSQSKVAISCRNQTVDACDVLQLLSLGAGPGTELTFSATGEDAEEVLDALAGLFNDNFGL